MEKANLGKVTTEIEVISNLSAPVEEGQPLGKMTVLVNGEVYDTIDLVSPQAVGRLSCFQIFEGLLSLMLQR